MGKRRRPRVEKIRDWMARTISRLAPDRYRPYRFVGGRIYLNLHESPMMVRRALGSYELQKVRLILRRLQAGMTFVDVGANKGDFTLIAARIVGPKGAVISIEPEPGNFEWLARSIDLNGYCNVRAERVALSDTEGTARLWLGEKSGWHTLFQRKDGEGDSVEVATRTLDSLVAQMNVPRVDMLKIDVEGWELPVLRGAMRTLRRNPKIVLLLDIHPQLGANVGEITCLLREIGLRLYLNCDPRREIFSLPEYPTDIAAARSF